MKKSVKTLLALLLVCAMFMSMGFVQAMAEGVQQKGTLVFLGDSMSYDFLAKNNYLDPMVNIYPKQAADAMGLEMSNAGAIPGGRITDAYTFMSDYEGDDYFRQDSAESEWPVGANLAEKKANYQKALSEAEVITIQMGYSGTSIFCLNNLQSVLKDGKLEYSADLAQLFAGDELGKVMPFVNKSVELAKKMVDDTTMAALKEYMAQLSDKEKEALNALFGEETVNTLSGVGDTVGMITDTFVYFTAAHIIHFDRAVARIKELNPDVELYVMGLTNPVQHLKLAFTLGELSYVIPLGDMLSVFYDVLNIYMKVLSPYSTQYYFVDNIVHAYSFGEAMANDPECARDILYSYYNNGWNGGEYPNDDAYIKASERAVGVSMALSNTQTIDVTKILLDVIGASELSLNTDESALDKLVLNENDELTATYLEQLMAHVFLFQIMKGIYVHPTQEGHNAEAPLLIAAMQKKQVAPEAIAYHKLAAPAEKALEELNNCNSIYDLVTWAQSLGRVTEQMKLNLKIGLAAALNSFMKKAIQSTAVIIKNILVKSFVLPVLH